MTNKGGQKGRHTGKKKIIIHCKEQKSLVYKKKNCIISYDEWEEDRLSEGQTTDNSEITTLSRNNVSYKVNKKKSQSKVLIEFSK